MSVLTPVRKAICLATVRSKLTPESALESTIGRIMRLLGDLRLGVRVLGVFDDPVKLRDSVKATGCEGLIIIVGTGGTEPIIHGALRDLDLHTLLIAHEAFNSLPAMLEAYAALRLEGKKWVNTVFLELSRLRESREILVEAMRPLFAVISIKGSRIGLIGRPAPWLLYSKMGRSEVRELFGAELIDIPAERLKSVMDEVEPPRTEVEGLRSVASPRLSVEQLEKALRLYYALRNIVEGYGLSALTIECFQAAEILGVTPCYALARLNSEDVDAGCEGDVPSLLTLMLLRRLSGQPAMMGNIASIRDGDITVAHCTAPLGMAINYLLDTHMETGLGVGVAARLPQGRQVTLARVDPRRGRLVMLTGRIVESGMLSPRLCRTQVVIKTGRRLHRILEDPFGSHIVFTIGNIVDQLRVAARLLGLEAVEI